jgi:lambda repressor-like predicted transcriptional regulator
VSTKRGEKVLQLLQQQNKTPYWLSKVTGLNRQSIMNWLEGAKPHDESVWDRIAEALDVEPNVIRDDALSLPSQQEIGSLLYPVPTLEVALPLWPALPADENWDLDPSSCTDFFEVPGFLARSRTSDPERIVAPIQGHSMEPRLLPGDYAVIVLDHLPRTGRMILARSEKGRTIKVLRRGRMGYELHSINNAHGQATAEKWEIEGYVIAILRDYAKGRGNIEWDEGGLGP